MKRWLEGIGNATNDVNVLIGAWLFLSPWILGFANIRAVAAWDAWVLGIALVVTGIRSTHLTERAEAVTTLAFGELVFLSPWVLSFARSAAPAANATIVGLLTVLVAVRVLLDDPAVGEWLRKRFEAL